jgi:hypothetical protein
LEFCAINYRAAPTFRRLFTSGAALGQLRLFPCFPALKHFGDALKPLLATVVVCKACAPFSEQKIASLVAVTLGAGEQVIIVNRKTPGKTFLRI